MKKILVVDNHAIVRAGLRRLLLTLPNIEVLEVLTGEDALAALRHTPVELMLLDLNLPGLGGLELLRRLLRTSPGLRVIVFSMHAEPIYAVRALKAGAHAYVSKNAGPEELLEAVRAVLRGEQYVEREIAEEIGAEGLSNGDYLRPLTRRDLEIIQLLAQGRSLTEIAAILGVAYKTVANSCGQIKEKLGVTRTADLVRIFMEEGIV